uniref:Uncharacterized protein n=1 Tax=Anguilla anguilla TaxID=7936 RepID=A0A0E9WE25_ANGAN
MIHTICMTTFWMVITIANLVSLPSILYAIKDTIYFWNVVASQLSRMC